jgi:hypothetical protein
MNLSDLYASSVAGRGSINTTGLTSTKGLQTQFERDPTTKKLEKDLNKTLSNIFKKEEVKRETNLTPAIEDDAQQNVLKAIEELKKLNAL